MPRLPDRLPSGGEFAFLMDWLNQLRDFVASLQIKPTINAEVDRTAVGQIVRPKAVQQTTQTSGGQYWL